jgi:hypothetical protein
MIVFAPPPEFYDGPELHRYLLDEVGKCKSMTDYKAEDFSKCVFNPLKKDVISGRAQELTEKYTGPCDVKSLLKYIIAVYDPKSPIVKEYPELEKRKEAGAMFAGIDEEYREKLFSCENEEDAKLIIQYLKIVKSRVWGMMVSIEQTIWEYNQRLFIPISAEKDKDSVAAVNMKSKMAEDVVLMNERLENLSRQFYGDDVETLKTRKVVERFTPEAMARVI